MESIYHTRDMNPFLFASTANDYGKCVNVNLCVFGKAFQCTDIKRTADGGWRMTGCKPRSSLLQAISDIPILSLEPHEDSGDTFVLFMDHGMFVHATLAIVDVASYNESSLNNLGVSIAASIARELNDVDIYDDHC